MKLGEGPIRINWFANPAIVAAALGLLIELPDLEIEDSIYWDNFDRGAWRAGLRGRVAMTDEELRRIDADWVRLKRLDQYAEIWFDIEEGIVIQCKAADAGRVVGVIRALAACHEIPLAADGRSIVIASQCIAGGGIPWGEDLIEVMRPAGFQWDKRYWVLPA
jgi:hypothetical protein